MNWRMWLGRFIIFSFFIAIFVWASCLLSFLAAVAIFVLTYVAVVVIGIGVHMTLEPHKIDWGQIFRILP